MATSHARMTIDNATADDPRLAVNLEYTFTSGDTMTFAFRPPALEGEGIAQLQRRMLEAALQRIEGLLARTP